MKKIKVILTVILIISQFMTIGCNNNPNRIARSKKKAIVKIDSSAHSVINNNVTDERSMSPYKQVDIIVQLIKSSYRPSEINKLNSICCNSDGDLSESLGEITMQLFYSNLNALVSYFLAHPKSCFEVKLIEGISANFSVYEKKDRQTKLNDEQLKIIKRAKAENLTPEKIRAIKKIFERVNPNLLD